MQAVGFVRHFGSRDLRTTCGDQLKGGDLEWEPGLRGPHFAPSELPGNHLGYHLSGWGWAGCAAV